MANQVTTVSFVQPGGEAPTGVNEQLDMNAIDGDLGQVLALALTPGSGQGRYLRRLFLEPDITAEAVVDNGTTPLAAQLVDLDDVGVKWPAATMRLIKWRWWQQTDNDRWLTEYERWVLGGTTPVLLGSRRLIHSHGVIASTVVAYGVCHAACNFDSSDTAITTAVGTSDVATSSTAGSSIGNISTNTAVLTHPVARDGGKRVMGINASSDVATASESLYATVFPGASSTTMSIYTADTATPSADGFDDDGRLEVAFFIEPPGDCNLVMNSTHVEMQITGVASDETRHRVEIFIGRAVQVAFQGS
jgi:hypothetical protein